MIYETRMKNRNRQLYFLSKTYRKKINLFIYLSIYLFIYLSIYLFTYLPIYLSISIYLSINLSIKVDTVEMHEPYTYLNGLSITDLEDLLEDILVSISLIKWPI